MVSISPSTPAVRPFMALISVIVLPSYEGKTITEISAMKGRTAGVDGEIETIFDLMSAGGASMIYRLMGEADMERIMRYPNTAIASDGSVSEPGAGNPPPRSSGTNARG